MEMGHGQDCKEADYQDSFYNFSLLLLCCNPLWFREGEHLVLLNLPAVLSESSKLAGSQILNRIDFGRQLAWHHPHHNQEMLPRTSVCGCSRTFHVNRPLVLTLLLYFFFGQAPHPGLVDASHRSGISSFCKVDSCGFLPPSGWSITYVHKDAHFGWT